MPDETKPAGRKRGPRPKGEVAMSGAERNRLYRLRKREQQAKGLPTPEQWKRAQQAHDLLAEAAKELSVMWNKLNGNRKFESVHNTIGKALDACGRACYLLEPVYHLPVSKDEPHRLICGSTDFDHVTNDFAIKMIYPERRCPECMARRSEFYP